MRKFLLVLEIGPMRIGEIRTSLALHSTLMPRFNTSLSPAELLQRLRPIIERTHSVQLISGKPDIFGPSKGPKTIPVNRLEQTPALLGLHSGIFDILSEIHATYDEPGFVGVGFTPHVSAHDGKGLAEGQTYRSQAVYLIEILHTPDGTRKHVQERITFQ
jgi:hypothetical protein